jgi:hypothetical protein
MGKTIGVQLLSGAMLEFFSFPPCPDQVWAHIASYSIGTRDFYPGHKAVEASS